MDSTLVSTEVSARGSGTTVTVAAAVFVASGCCKDRSNLSLVGGKVTRRLLPPRHDFYMRFKLLIFRQKCSLGRNQKLKQL